MLGIKTDKIILNNDLLHKIVYSINTAIAVDVFQEFCENRLETNNRIRLAYGDHINENLRRYAVERGKVELISFTRYAWAGRILVDYENKVTYTICTEATLKAVARKHGLSPHYLKSILFVENHEYEGVPKQVNLADLYPDSVPFTPEELEVDYDKIMQGQIDKLDGYIHYVIVYRAERFSINEIRLVLLDKDITEVESVSLMAFMEPDFGFLTQPDFNVEAASTKEEEVPEKRRLVKVRSGFKPALGIMEDEA